MENDKIRAASFGVKAVYLNIIGIVFSGLVFPLISTIFFPQPQWVDAQLFISSFHPVQTLTFFCGYFLVIGSLLTFISLYLLSVNKKVYALSGLIINVVFTAVIFLNYIIQTTYVPYLAANNPPETEYVLATFSMAKAGSFAWALEMYGWGGIGLSFIFMSMIFNRNRQERLLKSLFIINGICSCVTAIVTSIDMNWIFSAAGFTSLIVWNLLVLIIDIILLKYFKKVKEDIIKTISEEYAIRNNQTVPNLSSM